jgi:Tol biopolymer transport system component
MNQTEIFTMDFSGTNNVHQITKLNATSLTPKFLPNGNDLIIFSSNYGGGGEEQQSSYVNMKNWPFSLFIANRNGNCVKKVRFQVVQNLGRKNQKDFIKS